MTTLKSYNSILDDKEDNINYNELNKYCLNRSIKIPESKTFPQPIFNLPNDEQLVNRLLKYENKDFISIPFQIIRMFKDMPFKWLSKVSKNFDGKDEDVLIIDDPDSLPQDIKKYVQKFYTDCFGSAGFCSYIYTDYKGGVLKKSLGFKDFLSYHELHNISFFKYNNYFVNLCADTYHLFDGITIENFYSLYFKSGLSKEFIFRFLRNDEFVYSVNYQEIEKQVEEILNKH